MVSVQIKRSQVLAVQAALGGLGKGVQKEIAFAVNATAKKTRLEMGRLIRKKYSFKASVVKQSLSVKGKATKKLARATVKLGKGKRMSLREFAARPTKKGVSYTLNKETGKQFAPGAFMWRGHVFRRHGEALVMTKGRYQGKVRQRIIKLWGLSALRAYNGKTRRGKKWKSMLGPQLIETEAELKKQIQKRINYLKHKAAGTLRGKQAA